MQSRKFLAKKQSNSIAIAAVSIITVVLFIWVSIVVSEAVKEGRGEIEQLTQSKPAYSNT